MKDLLIVGAGFSGIAVSHEAEKRGISFTIADANIKASATFISGGLINPVSGRKYQLQWNIDELLSSAKKMYTEIENLTYTKILHEKSILKIHKSETALEEWLLRKGNPELNPYIEENIDLQKWGKYIDYRFGAIRIKQALQVDAKNLVDAYLKYLQNKNNFIAEKVDAGSLKLSDDSIEWGNEKFRHIIFSEGISCRQNPFFKYIPFKPAKGECIIIHIPHFSTDLILQKDIFVIPLGDNQFWVGATHSWEPFDLLPSEEGKTELISGLKNLFKVEFNIISHYAAIRPSVRDRLPVLGRHPEIKNMFVLNGMGTKGASLAPYYAKHLLDHIFDHAALPESTDIKRFEKLYLPA